MKKKSLGAFIQYLMCARKYSIEEYLRFFLDKMKIKVTLWVGVEPHCRHIECCPSGFYVDVNYNGLLQSLSIGYSMNKEDRCSICFPWNNRQRC